MNAIRAKFNCAAVESWPTTGEKQGESVTLTAVTNGSPEDNTFAAATPSAQLTKSITNPAAWGFFVVGKQYYADFTVAE
jgi:hypothetical protein